MCQTPIKILEHLLRLKTQASMAKSYVYQRFRKTNLCRTLPVIASVHGQY